MPVEAPVMRTVGRVDMIDFLLEGGPQGRAQLVEVPAVEFESGGRPETVDGSMMTIIIKHVKCWMMIDINV